MVGNNECDAANNFTQCVFDGGECCETSLIGNKICDGFNDFPTCGNHDGGDCLPFNNTDWTMCPCNEEYIGDGECDYRLKHKVECNQDGGNCFEHQKMMFACLLSQIKNYGSVF